MATQPDPFPSLRRRIEALESEVRTLRSRNPFFGTGFHPTANNGIESDDFDGDIDAADAGTKGWALNAARAALGELILRPGSIGNDALTNPVGVGAIFDFLQGFSLTTALTNIRTTNLVVPPGFSRAAISIATRVYAINPRTTGGYDGAGGDYLYGQANISGFNGFALPLAVSGSGGSGTNVSPFSVVLSDLDAGSTIPVQIAAATNFASWAANPANTAEVSGSVMWFR
ncbi:hypothetical protein [Knoellia koreensis]|uniref:Uncharacterized protein n=1 Tax=Knoellia koreensis TaxID=2730921 RepID=A0A849HKF9_9MICO|nr:hypothetical protein [Knoellia sp. DB2414S]NNM45137.1 hypothetical protein [Knoellia sp. DB2414S]